MALLKLRSITCLTQAESFTDELFVTFNGTKTSLPSMTEGQTKSLTTEFIFEGPQQLSLFEDDGNHWYDGDDFIAKHTISESAEDLTLEFRASSGNALPARYVMNVSVITDEGTSMTANLRLNSITCNEQAETFTDELYVTFNGTKRSLPNMTKGQTKMLNDEFLYEGFSTLSLFENDGNHWYDRDDFIDKHTITQTPANLTLDFIATSGNAEGAHYVINVSITRISGFNINVTQFKNI